MSSPAQEIKEKIEIVSFLRNYIELKPAGRNFKAVCPFHKEKSPSLIVSPDRQTWHCFGCNAGGDVFAFLMRYENIEFFEAIKILAEKAGVELRKVSLADQRQFGVLYDINLAAQIFFQEELKKSTVAQTYLSERGLKSETIEEFGIGFAPAGSENLTLYLIAKGFSATDIARAGLSIKSDSGGYFDRFRNRIMFPLFNHFGKTIGFTGRILPQFDTGEFGKYINSPETPIFNKSKVLYGFHKSKHFIREDKIAILVEGQMDFLMSWQDGVKNIIATSGTALTADHLIALQRIATDLILIFDSDEAGLAAGERAIDLADALEFNTKVLILKGFKDPAEVVNKEAGILKNFVSEAVPAMDFYFERYLKEDILKKPESSLFKKSLRFVLLKIKKLPSPVDRAYWLRRLSMLTGFSETVLLDELNTIKEEKIDEALKIKTQDNTQYQPFISVPVPQNKYELLVENIIRGATKQEKLKEIKEKVSELFSVKYKGVLNYLLGETASEEDELLANRIVIIDNPEMNYNLPHLVKELKMEYLSLKKAHYTKKIAELERSGNVEELKNAMKIFDETLKEINNFNK